MVEIPNITDTKKAKEFLGETAQLEFKEPGQTIDGYQEWLPTGLTGKDLKKLQQAHLQRANGLFLLNLTQKVPKICRFNKKARRKTNGNIF